MDELIELHRRALADACTAVDQVGEDNLTVRTPCADWDLAALLAHMIGEHRGFATAMRDGTATADAYAPVAFEHVSWNSSVEDLLSAFADADPDAPVLAVALHPTQPLPPAVVIGAQLLDTAVHTWDVAAAFGRDYTPDPAIVERVLQIADQIPDDDQRNVPGASFAPAVTASGDPWSRTLALLGRAR